MHGLEFVPEEAVIWRQGAFGKSRDSKTDVNYEERDVNDEEPDDDDVADPEKTIFNLSQSDDNTEEEEYLTCEFCQYEAPNRN